jgi:hypothetical protein
MAKTTIKLTPHGRTQNFPLLNPPASGWHKASDWATWNSKLPNAYTYRLRVVDKNGKPIPIKRLRGTDALAHLYVGETGIKNNDPSFRGEKLARGVTDKAVGTAGGAHGGAKKFWAEGWDAKLKAIDPDFVLQFGWDEHTEEAVFAAKDERLPASQQKDQSITNSGKGLAMKLEDDMLRQYVQEHSERPPLNSADGPGLRDRDRKTKRDLSQDVHDIG